jgi:hypothetical protein
MYWAGLRPKTDIPRASNSKQAYTFHWATPGLHTLALTGHNLQPTTNRRPTCSSFF